MKKFFTSIAICLIVCISIITLIGCNNEFAKQEYNDVEKIAQSDRFAKQSSVFNTIGNRYYFTASKSEGRETLWQKNIDDNVDMELQLGLRISNGNAKVVYIDRDNNVTVLVECAQDSSDKQSTTTTLNLKSGLNKLKIVGYDCKNIDLEILFPLFHLL